MKVVMMRDIKGTGRAHTAVEVADGHGLNFLIPKGFAVLATSQTLKQAELRQAQVGAKKALDMQLLASNLAVLAQKPMVISKKVNEKDHLYETVDAEAIVAAIKARRDLEVPAEAITLEKPIKEVGTYEIEIHAGETKGKFTVIVEAET